MTTSAKNIIRDEEQSRIIATLREGAKTITQLGSATGINDRSIRSAMRDLEAQKFVLRSGYHNRSILWRLNSSVAGIEEYSGRLPYHDIRVTGTSANLVDITLAGMVKCQPVPPKASLTRADYYTRIVYPLLAKYLGLITAFEPDMDELSEVKQELLQAYKTLSSTAFMVKQILEYEEYWKLDSIKFLREAPLMAAGAEEINNAYLLAQQYLKGESLVPETMEYTEEDYGG